MVKRRVIAVLLFNVLSSGFVSAAFSNLRDPICTVLMEVYCALQAAAPTLVIIMFLYGGAKYAYSADDPSGRKAGKTIAIQALIAGIILLIALTTAGNIFNTVVPILSLACPALTGGANPCT